MIKNQFIKYSVSFCLIVFSFFFSFCILKKDNENRQEVKWVGTWATAPMLIDNNHQPPDPGLKNNTLRQVVRVSIGGNLLSIRFSNLFGKESTTMKAVYIAVAKDDGCIDTSTQRSLTFNGNQEVTMDPKGEVVSDSLRFSLTPSSRLAISIHFGDVSSTITGHPGSRTNSYLTAGNYATAVEFAKEKKVERWYIINGINVKTTNSSSAIAILGNSITDGKGSDTDQHNRWTDILSERLLNDAKKKHIGVLNLGIGGNTILQGGIGPTALKRFDSDILLQKGVRWLIILQGINDIGGIKAEIDLPKTVKGLIDAYCLMVDKAHEKGVKVYGCTMLPFSKSFYDSPYRQVAWKQLNNWIRNSGKFDEVIDFEKIMSSSEYPGLISDHLHNGDFLHPNKNGYKVMGEAIKLDLFK